MNLAKYKWFVFSCLFFLLNSCVERNPQIKYLKSFAEVYGYVKYFHPSDEASKIDWDKFAIYGVEEVLKCKSSSDFEKTLKNLFEPIAPSILFSSSKINKEKALSNIEPQKTNLKQILWLHKGVGMGMELSKGVYTSKRVLRTEVLDSLSMAPQFGESISTKLESGINVFLPIVLFSDEEGTYPKNSNNGDNGMIEILEKFEPETTSLSYRLGNIVNTYNIFKHFYPYFDVIDNDWEPELDKAILKSFVDQTKYDHTITLRKFLAPLKDGHITVTALGENPENYDLPISWEWIDEKLIVTGVWNDSLKIEVGEEVTHIDNVKSKRYFEDIKSQISAGTEGWLSKKSIEKSISGAKNSKLSIKVKEKDIELVRNTHTYDIPRPRREETYKELGQGIHYINLSMIDLYTFEYLAPSLDRSKGVIFDLRGYPNQNHQILSHFIQEDIEFKEWMQVPIRFTPKNIAEYKKYDFKLRAKGPFVQPKKVVFITDGSAISYAESVMNMVKKANIGAIIGQPTAGANGNFNRFFLPGNIEIKFTGMRAYKYNKELFHCKGVLPDIYLTKTKEGILSSKDEFLEKAIELVQK